MNMPVVAPKILIIDDSQMLTDMLKDALTTQGNFRVVSAPDGASGLAIAETERPDLILLDISMPGLSGYEICRIIKNDEKLRHIPIVIISALSADEDKEKAFIAGADGYLVKPIHIDNLLTKVNNLL
ncbi:response regulator [bacterium]|nr:response regulator [FCB group bacterium]MBL7191213.1 response regulator [bacterium]